MTASRRILAASAAAAAAVPVLAGLVFAAGPAAAAVRPHGPGVRGSGQAVFVQNDRLAGNQVIAYHRAADGTLAQAGRYGTGGLGGQLAGSVADHLGSQGSLAYDRAAGLLYAVNAGSNTVSVFGVRGDRLYRRQVIGSGGTFPVSVTIHDGLVYVLNALNGGSVQGFWQTWRGLVPIPGSNRPLHLNPNATPQFVNTPGQVAFTPDGRQLLVTTKANTSSVDVFGVRWGGRLSASPVVNSEPGAVPFAITYDQSGHVVIAEAGTNALATFSLHRDGTLTQLDQVGTGQAATCWVTADGAALFASNAGSNNISRYGVDWQGQLTLAGQTGTDAGTVDSAVTGDGRYLYVQAGVNGNVDEFAVSGTQLTPVGSVTVPDAAGGEGIAAS